MHSLILFLKNTLHLQGSIPDDVKAFMEGSVRAGIQLGRVIKLMAYMGFKTTWATSQIKDLQKRISRALKDATFDHVWDELSRLQASGAFPGLYVRRRIDGDGTITAIYVTLPLAYAVLKRWGSVRVFDVTYNTNRYGLFLGVETCKTSSGVRVPTALSFVTDLTVDSYAWHLECSADVSPAPLEQCVYIVDQDAQMIDALKAKGIHHFIGQWHLWQLIDKHGAGPFKERWDAARRDLARVWRSHNEAEWKKRWDEWQVCWKRTIICFLTI
jgi:hypothetical protein